MDRRLVLKALGTAGVTSAVFGRALAAAAEAAGGITADTLHQAEAITGVTLSDAQREMMLKDVGDTAKGYAALRAVAIGNEVPPALVFDPVAGRTGKRPRGGGSAPPAARPAGDKPGASEDVAFAPVAHLAGWLRTKQISSTELTKLYLARIEKNDPVLRAVITRTDRRALDQAAAADAAIAKGRYLGPLHGVPWVCKDLIAVPGYPTTWGAGPFKEQTFEKAAAVVERLDAAGAVLLAKSSVGELAWGDVWYAATTKNPWKPEQGSSGSSAGSASLVAAGCAGFALGTETWGSVVSPCTRCGASGLRPTFGRVSRRGVMALAWSMDKVGTIARSAHDCAVVFDAIRGADPGDPSTHDASFVWPRRDAPRSLRVGYVKSLFEADYKAMADKGEDTRGYEEWQANDKETLAKLKGLGYELVPVELPSAPPIPPLGVILSAEAATAFDVILRDGRVDGLARQTADAWPNVLRQGELVPAVEYLRANRARTLLMRAMDALFETIDVYVVPSFGGDNLLLTNLTGHPAAVVPNGFRPSDGTPTSITFQAALDADELALSVADAFQAATDFHTRRPPLS